MKRPFRFIAPMPKLTTDRRAWLDRIRQIEDLGYSTVSISDHFIGGATMDPIVLMAAAAEATDRLRILSLVLGNDYRHPVVVHRAMATLDVLSSGRVEVGMGAGWLKEEYEALGLRFDGGPTRIDRLEEAVAIVRQLFRPEPATLDGRHYRVQQLVGQPRPVQEPHPPILIGGGSRGVLEVAARHADIIGVYPRLAGANPAADLGRYLAPERYHKQIGWIHGALQAEDRAPKDVELQLSMLVFRLADANGKLHEAIASIASGLSAEDMVDSPAVLVGSVDHCVDRLRELREVYGFSYIALGSQVEAAAAIVARLAGT